jgi:hypothetical protein
MKISAMPKETAAELLIFLAEHEEFSSVTKLLEEGITVEEIRTLFREVASELLRESAQELKDTKYDTKKDAHLSPQAKKIISYLSPHEEKTLLEAFGLVDKQ